MCVCLQSVAVSYYLLDNNGFIVLSDDIDQVIDLPGLILVDSIINVN